jgi:hypothetical protein
MNDLRPQDGRSTATNLHRLDGRLVLVKSTRDRRNPPAGLRGWIEVHQNSGAAPQVSIAVEFPQMFSAPAHRRTMPLDQAGLERLLASEHNGTFEFTIDDELA